MIDTVMSYLGRGLVDGTVLAAITGLFAVTVFRRARPAVLSAMWTIVLIKFVVPFGPKLPISVSGLVDSALPDATRAAAVAAVGAPSPALAAGSLPAAGSGLWAVAKLAVLVSWAVIALALIARAVIRQRSTVRAARRLPVGDRAILAAVARATAAVGLRRGPDVRVCSTASSPYLVGLAGPILVIPKWLAGTPRALDAAIVHELAHLRRRDHWLRAFEVGVRCVFFFWPVVAWTCRRVEVQREMACDEWACASDSMDRASYARFLVTVARRARARVPAPAIAMALVRTRSELESRVDSLISRHSKPRVGAAFGGILLGWAAVGLGGAAAAPAADADGDLQCVVEPGVREQILASYPDADRDGDGVLSTREVCAHQLRMKRKLLDGMVDAELISQLDPDADLDGDGILSGWEIEWFKDQVDIAVVGDDAGLVLQRKDSRVPLRRDGVRLQAASVSAPVCDSPRCADDASAGDARLLITVDFDVDKPHR